MAGIAHCGIVFSAVSVQSMFGRNVSSVASSSAGVQKKSLMKDWKNVKNKSATRRKREAEAKPFRDTLIAQVGECENCGCSPADWVKMPELARLSVHEIADGTHRQQALDKPYAVLVLCWACNSGPFKYRSEWPEARQLALLARRRPRDFDLTAYLELTSPNAPSRITIDEVLAFMEEDYLTKQDIAKRMQVDRRAVQNWISEGKLPAIDARAVGASRPLWRVSWSDYLEFCKARRV